MLIFSDNAEAELKSALTALAMDETRLDTVTVDATEALKFATPEYGREMHVTLSDPSSAPGVTEIAVITEIERGVTDTVFTLRRVRDYDHPEAKSWAIGAKLAGRVTAAMLRSFVQADSEIPGVFSMDIVNPQASARAFAFRTFPVVSLGTPVGSDYHQDATNYPAGTEVIFRTRNVDIGGPPPHNPSSWYSRGDVVVPAPANGRQYQLLVKDAAHSQGTVAYGAITFPNSDYEPVDAFDAEDPPVHVGWWVPTPMPIVLEEALPSGFVLTEFGFLAVPPDPSPPATPAVVSVGTAGDNVKFLDHGSLAGPKRITVPNGAFGEQSLVFTVHSQADVSLFGSFYFKGFVVHTGS